MNHQRYRGLFQKWEAAVAIKVVREFKSKWKCLAKDDEEDLLQECLTHWLFVREGYDPNGGASQNTYMSRVIKNKLMDLVDEQSSDKRKTTHLTDSINQPLSDDEDSFSLSDVLADDTDFQFRADLKISIEQTFSQLTETQKALCRYLRDGYSSMTELSELLGVGRATVYREIERIRDVFRKEGLKDFLK